MSQNKYYRLRCLQNGNYMATGYNAESPTDLFEQYESYKSNDWEEEEMGAVWKTMTDEEKWNFILDDEFEIEESSVPFPPQE